MKKLISPRKILIYAAIIILLVSGQFLNKPSMNDTNIFVVMLGIDKIDEEYNISVKYMSPAADEKQHTSQQKFLSSSGKNVAEAVQAMALMSGREVSLAHCNTIALSDAIVESDVNLVTDYFIRTKKVGKNTILIHCGESARDFILAALYITNNLGIQIQDIAEYNGKTIHAKESTIEELYKGYFSKTKTSLMPTLKLTDDKRNGIEVLVDIQLAKERGGGGSGSQPPPTKYFSNLGEVLVLKKGKKILTLNSEQATAMNLLLKNKKKGGVTVSDINDENFENATLVLQIDDKETKISGEVTADKLKMKVSLDIKVRLEEIVKNDKSNQEIDELRSIIDQNVKLKTEEKIKEITNDLVEFCKEKKVDVIKAYDYFNSNHYKKFQKFLSSMQNEDDYLDHIEFEIKVKVRAGT